VNGLPNFGEDTENILNNWCTGEELNHGNEDFQFLNPGIRNVPENQDMPEKAQTFCDAVAVLKTIRFERSRYFPG
jgi:hypothetical protein